MAAEPSAVALAGIGDEAAPDLAGQIAAHRRLGWSHIELRTIDGAQIADMPLDAVSAVAEELRSEGLEVVGVSSGIGAWGRTTGTPLEVDERELEALAPRAAALGCTRLRVMSFLQEDVDDAGWRAESRRRLGELARRAEQLGLTLLHENCAGYGGRGPEESLELMAGVDSPALRLLFDTGNGLSYGYDSLDFLRPTLDWTEHVHVKDAVRRGDDVEYVPPGEGDGQVEECLALLLSSGYRGGFTIEPHMHVAPHRGERLAGDGATASFVECGRALERLMERVAEPARGGAAAG
ncbi:MAG TPA: sugar phosphate isomerase/epimerase family protein [Thermoleophilaceae bacterium]